MTPCVSRGQFKSPKQILALLALVLAPSVCGFAAPSQVGDPFQQGLAALKENRLDVALQKLTLAEQERGDDPRVRNFRGVALAELGRRTEARAEYREAIRLDPHMAAAFRNLGYLDWTEHRLDDARRALEAARQLDPQDHYADYYLARVELEAGNDASAIESLDRSEKVWPADVVFLMTAAAAYLGAHRDEAARQALGRLQGLPLTDAQSVSAGRLLFAAHDPERALALFRTLSQQHAADSGGWAQFDLALALVSAGQDEAAVTQAQSILAQSASRPRDSDHQAQVYSVLGIAYARLGNRPAAILAFRQAAELAPDQEERWLDLTRELMDASKYADAIVAVQEGLVHKPRSYALHLRLGAAYLRSGRYADAESAFRDLTAQGDPLPTSYIGLAQVLLRTGRAQEAASELASASYKLGPSFLLAYFRGIALERAGREPEAVVAFQEAVRLDPANAEALLGLGRTELHQRQLRPALDSLCKVLRLDPGSRQARALLSQAYRLSGNATAASEYARQTPKNAPKPPADNLVGDFLIPEWQLPPATSKPNA